jgi:hypothetical protein
MPARRRGDSHPHAQYSEPRWLTTRRRARKRPGAIRLLCQAAAAAVLQADLEDPAARGAAGCDRLLDPTPLDSDRDLTPAEQQRPRALVPSAAGIAADFSPVMHAATSWGSSEHAAWWAIARHGQPAARGPVHQFASPLCLPADRLFIGANPTPPAPGPGPTAARIGWLSTGTALPAGPVGWHVAASVPRPGVVEDRRPCSRRSSCTRSATPTTGSCRRSRPRRRPSWTARPRRVRARPADRSRRAGRGARVGEVDGARALAARRLLLAAAARYEDPCTLPLGAASATGRRGSGPGSPGPPGRLARPA